jgi:hypothetical protein
VVQVVEQLLCKLEALNFKPKSRKKEGRKENSQALEAHTCNPRYSGGRNEEKCSLKPAQANSFQDPILRKTHHQRGLVEWLKL